MRYKVTLNNRVYEVEVDQAEAMLIDEYDVKAPASPAPAAASPAVSAAAAAAPAAAPSVSGDAVKSPMPGNILKINVSQGQTVNEGDVLLILEAMKMENEISAAKSGTVAQILVSKGAVVETGTPLIVIA